jgi:hypothetical protein
VSLPVGAASIIPQYSSRVMAGTLSSVRRLHKLVRGGGNDAGRGGAAKGPCGFSALANFAANRSRNPEWAGAGPDNIWGLKMNTLRALLTTFLALAALASSTPVRAQTVADFYRGKTLTMVVATSPGGDYGAHEASIGH